ncbi:hypothetical protein BC940DRAFT_58210 [Gongronella butleri]|nr:hypothetical protein BC940DRAFT_58210 [Gongronella butleri]
MSAASRWRRNRLYFATFRSFLFYMSSGKASSPDPCTFVAPEHDLLGLGTHRSQPTPTSPYATAITPFAGNTHEISSEWQTAELRRRMNLIKNAKGYIDLTEVAYVRRAFADPDDGDSDDHAFYATSAISSIAASSSTPLFHGHEASSSAHPRRQHGSLLELVMNNGLCIKLKAFDNSTCEQWVTCLSNLITYYKAHLEAERDVYCDQPNFTTPIDTPSQITSSPPEPKVDTRIWNLCIFEQCQDVAKSGILYMQRDQSVFSQRQFILTADGWLHYYNVYARSATTGEPEVTAVHERKSSFDLANAYVFSGWASRARHRGRAGGGGSGGAGGGRAALTGSGSDAWNDDRPSRLFANGLIATDANHECSFTLWFPKPRRVFSPKRQRILVYPTDQRFNAKGTRFHFLAANRQAKEEWVNVIKIVQEQLLREAMAPQNTDTDAS